MDNALDGWTIQQIDTSPFRSHDRGVLFVCPHCNAPHRIPVNYNAGPLPSVKYENI